jgi:hypothetical protein
MILVPLPRLVLPTLEPPFWPLQSCRPYKPHDHRFALAVSNPMLSSPKYSSTDSIYSIVGISCGKFDTEDNLLANPSIGLLSYIPKACHSEPHVQAAGDALCLQVQDHTLKLMTRQFPIDRLSISFNKGPNFRNYFKELLIH